MKVEIFTLCDAATTSQADGKLNILGSFDRLFAVQTPITYPLCALAVKVRFVQGEEGAKRLKLSFIDSDGRLVMPALDAQIIVQIPSGESSATIPICLIMQQIKLPHFGEYAMTLTIDGREEASVPLYVRQLPSQPAQQLPPSNS
jgi:hypothetical protein